MMAAYLIGMMDITDPKEFARYVQGAAVALTPFRGKCRQLASTAASPVVVYEGDAPASHMFIFEFESRELFDRFYNSPSYQEIIAFRHRGTSTKVIMVMEGA